MSNQQQDLRELLANAQTALEEGRHQEATVACRHVLRDYPESATAMRLLGESYLEAGRADEAVRAFEKVLGIDPHNVLARVGLGVLAEDRGEDERAIAQFRQAWEVAPTLPQLRSELVRLYRKRYGVGGRLRMTRLALANLHAQNDDLPRAIRQFQQLFDEDPARPEVAIGLAEALWRHGDRDEAAAHCRALLGERPRLARPALILAAIRGDGDDAAATELLATTRGFDPDAVIARDLLAMQPSPTLTRFVDEPVAMTPFDPATLDIAGIDELLGAQASTLGEESFRWEDIADGLTGDSSLRPETAAVAVDNAAGEPDTDDVDALFAAIDRQLSTVDIDDELPVFTMPHEGDLVGEVSAADEVQGGWDADHDDAMVPDPDEPTAVELLTANWDNIDNELAAARPRDDAPAVVTGMLGEVELDLKPFDVESDAEPEAEQTITFDPAKFSLPPLDGEDDDDLDAALEAEDLGVDISPFNLDEVGPKTKTSGLTFAELVRKEAQGGPTARLPEDQFTDILGDNVDLSGMTSIFATRELAPVAEDRVLDTQALPIESSIPPPITEPQSLDATALLATLPLAQQASAAGDAERAAEATAPDDAPVASETDEESQTKQPRTFAELFDQHSARREGAVAAHQPDATRPLLAHDDLVVPEGPAEAEARHLFERLRNNKPERADTGELEFEPDRELRSDPAAPQAASAEWSAEPAADAADVDLFESVTMDSPVLDDWLMSLAPSDAEERGAGYQVAARGGDDWLIDYPLAADDSADDYRSLADAETMFDHDSSHTPWEIGPVDDRTPTAAAGRFAADKPWRDKSVSSWATELPAANEATDEPYAAALARPGSAARTNGSHPAGATTAAAQPARVEPERPTITVQDLDEQRAILESLVQADPGNPFARLTLAVAYSSTDLERALNEYRRLIKESDELVPEIIERLKEMIADGDAPARAHRILGDAYMKLGQFDLAMTEFQRALSARSRARK